MKCSYQFDQINIYIVHYSEVSERASEYFFCSNCLKNFEKAFVPTLIYFEKVGQTPNYKPILSYTEWVC